MDPLIQVLSELPKLFDDYKKVASRLEAAERELALLKDDAYVDWDWICRYFDITKPTAMAMLAEEKLFVYGKQVKRFKKSAILRFAERHSIKVNQLHS